MTLGNAAAASVRLLMGCLDCGHRSEPNAAEMVQRYRAKTSDSNWRALPSAAPAAIPIDCIKLNLINLTIDDRLLPAARPSGERIQMRIG
jgi:hypothetical protein